MSLFKALRTFKPLLLSNSLKRIQTNNTQQLLKFSTCKVQLKRADVTVTFIALDGTKMPAKAKEGDNLLDIIVDNEIDIDGFGACEGTLACSTCHLIFKQTDYLTNHMDADNEGDSLEHSGDQLGRLAHHPRAHHGSHQVPQAPQVPQVPFYLEYLKYLSRPAPGTPSLSPSTSADHSGSLGSEL